MNWRHIKCATTQIRLFNEIDKRSSLDVLLLDRQYEGIPLGLVDLHTTETMSKTAHSFLLIKDTFYLISYNSSYSAKCGINWIYAPPFHFSPSKSCFYLITKEFLPLVALLQPNLCNLWRFHRQAIRGGVKQESYRSLVQLYG